MATKKTYALIVEDENDWLVIFEEILSPDFNLEKAKTANEANLILEKRQKKFEFAIVDLKLLGDLNNKEFSGLQVLNHLRNANIPAIAASIYQDPETIRRAFVYGKVQDYWFKKGADIVELQEIINNIQKNKIDDYKSVSLPNLLVFVGFPFSIFILLIASIWLVPQELARFTIQAGLFFSGFQIVSLALFSKRITGKQFVEILTKLFTK
jgi:CheY-like chemotaxis protein